MFDEILFQRLERASDFSEALGWALFGNTSSVPLGSLILRGPWLTGQPVMVGQLEDLNRV
jgi:hypothetical protein